MVVGFAATYAISAYSPLMLWVWISIRVRRTTSCDKVFQWFAAGQWFSPGSSVSSTNKTEILLKVVKVFSILTDFSYFLAKVETEIRVNLMSLFQEVLYRFLTKEITNFERILICFFKSCWFFVSVSHSFVKCQYVSLYIHSNGLTPNSFNSL